MNDLEIDSYITRQIRKRGITLYDMTGGEYIDPDPENKREPANTRARWNRFTYLSDELRMCELLAKGEFDRDLPYKSLAIPLKDLVRYW
jgi:hypothetical protein